MIEIKGIKVKEIPIKAKGIDFDKVGKKEKYLDKDNKEVTKIQLQGSEYKWVYADGKECKGKTFKSINGKAVKPFSKTAIVKSYDVVKITEINYFINNELTYLLVSNEFKELMKEHKSKDEAVTFKYVNRGFKVYKAVALYDEKLDKVLLRCFRGDLRKAELNESLDEKEEIEAEDGVEKLDLDSLEV